MEESFRRWWWPGQGPPSPRSYHYQDLLNKPVSKDFFPPPPPPSSSRPTWLSLLLAFLRRPSRFAAPLARLCLVVAPHLLGELVSPRLVPPALFAVVLLDAVIVHLSQDL